MIRAVPVFLYLIHPTHILSFEDRQSIQTLFRAYKLRKVRESISSNSSSSNHTSNGNHSKTSILKLSKLHFLLLLRISGVKSKRIKGEITRTTIKTISKSGKSGHLARLEEGDPGKDLDHGFWEGIVRVNDLGEGLEGELCAGDADEFGDYESGGGEHGSAAVLELSLAVPGEPFGGSLLD